MIYGNILDLVFSSEADIIEDVDVREPAVNSDHCTIHFKLVVRRQANNNPDRQTRDYNGGDWESIRRDLHAIAWKPLLEDKTCGEQLTIFTELIEQQIDRRIPWKRQRGKHTPMWIKKRMQKCIRRKRNKWKKFKDSGQQEDYLAFKVIQSQTTLAVKEAKRDFEKKLAKNTKKDSNSFYAYYREKNRSRVGIGPLEGADGQPVTDELEQAIILNSFFSSVYTKEEATDYELPLTRFSEEDNIRLTDIDITRDRVLQKLNKLDPTKAPGVDGISSRVLVELDDEVAEPLAAIFQNSLETGEVTSSWKVLYMTLLLCQLLVHDSGYTKHMACYRYLSNIRDKGLSEVNITLPNLLTYGRTLEATMQQANIMSNAASNGTSVHAVSHDSQNFSSKQGNYGTLRFRASRVQGKISSHRDLQVAGPRYDKPHYKQHQGKPPHWMSAKSCPGCGGQPHTRLKGKAWGKTCHKCHKENHFVSVCRSKVAHFIENGSTNDLCEDTYTLSLHHTTGNHIVKPYECTVSMAGKVVCLEIDTGASVSLISEREWGIIKNQPHN